MPLRSSNSFALNDQFDLFRKIERAVLYVYFATKKFFLNVCETATNWTNDKAEA